ncbi:chemotaxis response regulator protein-glutamate methylesterase [bacterium (Candidatus Blackallbacteria) CG17_big_fil_post_rev_8_21_14_2_50_48_46]|uniref:protein-glutamate methylesterase n=1 Tax=bacterium (Candidatus Blackallbacteria) CG17_big_fil_post_rev_8_21_14_2_50_48_46 TaxID=2014261 RepID=A0A2M7G706_9BACT|nr:MAG: chemotaxis response regulator protein-glutamate methylesterase [bacterium (Candidatus Blackallbacteria) CG18_big_fil_WC_8_21_14_2_50_49_26]PIW17835.1 MAG: chemotaxis response regulator protein-glutamate methylesterase [bacterium (Candidatus Blackallbacteria) CG17_big_fil_post_rev_8_21_14_2_50_48_46]PIW48511.1 MAG: chemotaxis response regulator protein-glutamate methylesterase [bacterium (Candidatus Blackallbacteria) CG13_big_fil_rev_8_21_14_2_50_49_14]
MSKAKTVRVLIVEDSPVMQVFLTEIINADTRLNVLGVVPSGEKALDFLKSQPADVISMDIRLPGMDGLETTRQIMQTCPTPIVVVSSQLQNQEMDLSFDALRAGALCVLDKPVGVSHPRFEQSSRQLCTQLLIMSQVKVIRQRLGRTFAELSEKDVTAHHLHRSITVGALPDFQVLGIAASTGGPKALSTLLNQLTHFPLPILLVQHIAPHFLAGFADWLNSVTPFRVLVATEGMVPLPYHVYLAPPERHLAYQKGKITLVEDEPVSYQRPSGTVLFHSLAESLGKKAIGLVLTGMGDDGAAGLLAMRHAGAYTLAEAESTAIVYGMPAAADKLGAVCHLLPLTDLASHLQFLVKTRATRSSQRS